MTNSASLRFLSWVRRGVGAAVAPDGPATTLRITTELQLRVTKDGVADSVPMHVELFGPADVTGFDRRQVIRTDPAPGSSEFEPNYFPSIEFDAPDLPWLFSPGRRPRAIDNDRLQPWICLVVVARDKAKLDQSTRPLPVLMLADQAALPNLNEAWAWAHAQVVGGAESIDSLLDSPAQNLSRLLCPRRLEPLQSYYACVVPTFLAGVHAGLPPELAGQPPAGAEPAWSAAGSGPLTLPVYYSWEFSTGADGDFEALARRLRTRTLAPTVGVRPVDFSLAAHDLGVPGAAEVLDMEGALRSKATAAVVWPTEGQKAFGAALEQQLDAGLVPGGQLGPPIYGGAQAGSPNKLPAPGTGPPWLRTLNLDPRLRAAAGFGARIVQQEREQLVASAWDQAAEIDRANQILRHAELGRAAATKVYERRFARMTPPSLLQVTGPAHRRLLIAANETVHARVTASALPQPAASIAFRRVARAGGPLGAALSGGQAQVVDDLAAARIGVQLVPVPSGLVSIDAVSRAVGSTGLTYGAATNAALKATNGWRTIDALYRAAPMPAGRVAAQAPAPAARIEKPPPDDTDPISHDPIDTGDIGETLPSRINRLIGIRYRFRTIAARHQDHLRVSAPPPPPPNPGQLLDLGDIHAGLVGTNGKLDPNPAHAERATAQVPLAARGVGDALAPLLLAPSYPQAMVQPLVRLSQELLLPGLGEVPPETIALVEGNAPFIEAYMVGLSHELTRQLLFHGFPADPRATFFRQFWDARGSVPGMAGAEAGPDVPPIVSWVGELGANATGVGEGGIVVLLLRGELIRRSLAMTISLGKEDTSGTIVPALYPLFRGRLDPDVLFVGFALSVAEARGPAGWLFLLEQHVAATRFGLDAARLDAVGNVVYGVRPTSCSDVTWTDLANSKEELERLAYASVTSLAGVTLRCPSATSPTGVPYENVTWGLNAAAMARITAQDPVRVAIPAAVLIPPE